MIDVVNKILVYVSELDNTILIPQYNYKNQLYYRINKYVVVSLDATLLMRIRYPIIFSTRHLDLYKNGIAHYENVLKDKNYLKVLKSVPNSMYKY